MIINYLARIFPFQISVNTKDIVVFEYGFIIYL